MAVDRGLLWSVLGFWGVVWVATIVAAVLAIGALVVFWSRGRPPKDVPGLPFYLDEVSAIAICEAGGYGEVVKRTVEERVAVNKDGTFGIEGRWFKFGSGGSRGREVVSTYDAHATANAVMGVVITALESENGIVHVDLLKQAIRADKAWRRAKSSRLSEIRQYVAVEGQFRVVAETGDKTVLRAPVGKAGTSWVRLVCDNMSLRHEEIPDGRFNAWCLGKCESWKDESDEIVVRPVAVFQ